MNSSKFFLSTLIAAAAMTVPAYADTITAPTWTYTISGDKLTAETEISGGFNFDLGQLAIKNGESFTLTVSQTATSWSGDSGTTLISTGNPESNLGGANNLTFNVGKTTADLYVNNWSYGSNKTNLDGLVFSVPESPSVDSPINVGFSFQFVNLNDSTYSNTEANKGGDYFLFLPLADSQVQFTETQDFNIVSSFNFSHFQNVSDTVSAPENVQTKISLIKKAYLESIAFGEQLTINGTLVVSPEFDNSGSVILGDGAKLIVADGDFSGGTYEIISGEGSITGEIDVADITVSGLMRGGSITAVENDGKTLKITTAAGSAETITWAGTASSNTWNSTSENWTLNDSATKFYYKDNVVFGSNNSTNQQVLLENGANLVVGTATISSGGTYEWKPTSDNQSATISGQTLTIEDGATLNLGSTTLSGDATSLVQLDFDNISVKGTLNNNTNANTTWRKLSFDAEGAHLYLKDIGAGDGTNGVWGFGIEKTIVNASATIDGKWGANVSLGALSGSGNLTLKNATDDAKMVYRISDLLGYSGTLTIESVSDRQTSAIITDPSKLGTTAKLSVGAGTTLALACDSAVSVDFTNIDAEGTIEKSGSGDATFENIGTIDTLKVSEGTATISGSASVGTLNISGGTFNVGDGGILTVNDGTDRGNTWAITGTVNVLAGGTAKFAGHDLMSWSETSGDKVIATLAGESDAKKATLYLNDTGNLTFTSQVQMKGNALISTENSSKFNTFGGKIVAKGTNNEISTVQIQLRKDFIVEVVGKNDELKISSVIASHKDDAGGLIKTGAGKLTLLGDNTFSTGHNEAIRTLSVKEGVLVAASVGALGNGATVSVESGAVLQLTTHVETTGAVVLFDGAQMLVDLADFDPALLVADADRMMLSILSVGTLSLGGVEVNGALSSDYDKYFDVTDSATFADYTADQWVFKNGSLSLAFSSSIPEPSAFGLLAGVGALALVAARRRRRR